MAERIQHFVVDMFYTATVKQSSKTIVKLFNRLNFIVIFRFIAIAKTNNVYEVLLDLEIIDSKYQFSEQFLGKCKNYYGVICSEKRKASNDLLYSSLLW